MLIIGSTVLPLNFKLASSLLALDGKPIAVGSSVAVILPPNYFPASAYAQQGLDRNQPSALSIQPDGAGTQQPRSVNAIAAYETGTLTAQGVVYIPDGVTPYLLPICSSVVL